jgi:bifunctional DNase/RNase
LKKVKLEILGIFSNQPQEVNFTLLLGEVGGFRRLPIMIGVIEAQSIALALEGSVVERPIMHDLFKEALVKIGYVVQEAVITGLKDGVFLAHLMLSNENQQVTLEARPSDAIAISLRFGAPLFISEALLNQVGGILVPRSEVTNLSSELANADIQFQPSSKLINNFENYSVQALQELLARVVERENYEQAALIRDELKRRSK